MLIIQVKQLLVDSQVYLLKAQLGANRGFSSSLKRSNRIQGKSNFCSTFECVKDHILSTLVLLRVFRR